MKRVLALTSLAAMLLSANVLRAQTGADSTVLSAIDYRTTGGACTLTMRFTDPVHFRFSQSGSRVSIRCAHTRVGSLAGGLEQQFASGGVQAVTVRPIGSDSATVTVMLREHQSASLSAGSAKRVLSLSVHAVAFAPAEISGLAPATKEDSSRAAMAAEAARGDKALPVIAASVAIAAGSTVIILLVIVRFGKRSPPATRLRRGETGIAGAPMNEELPEPEDLAERGSTGTGRNALASDSDNDGKDGFFDLGNGLRRQREEIALAMRLHTGPLLDASRCRARLACKSGATASERVRMAKRLGIGRGEIELAMRLKNMEEGHLHGGTDDDQGNSGGGNVDAAENDAIGSDREQPGECEYDGVQTGA
ncbi:MAG TPA: hypothetical protein VEO56_03210, partial [Bacteroidota bacterium]|nr:hypothetical protein [Bacteroidota bacterium]